MTRNQVEGLAALARIPVRSIYETPNLYWGGDNTIMGPWWLIVTIAGVIRVGWCKLSIEIDWSDTGRTVEVTKDDVVKEPTLVHASGYPKAVEYLTTLWQELGYPLPSRSDHK